LLSWSSALIGAIPVCASSMLVIVFIFMTLRVPRSTLFPYTTLFRSAVDKSIVITIEKAMLAYRNALKGNDESLVRSTYSDVNELIIKAQGARDNNSYSFGFTFWAALSILLREALEALLIIIVILSILRPLKIKKAIKFLHFGWIAALVIGVISWLFVDQLVKISGSSREMMEGVGSLIAVFVLIYMGTWLHSKSEVKKWKEFIEVKINKISKSGNWW